VSEIKKKNDSNCSSESQYFSMRSEKLIDIS
jgi:hypothetical protein